MGIKQKILDQFSSYDFKSSFAEDVGRDQVAYPSWVDDTDRRRLAAYCLLEAYCRNSAREWLNTKADEDSKSERREYGDPMMLVNTALSGLLGDKMQLMTFGAAGTEPNPEAVAQHELLQQWMLDEKLQMKVIENERQTIKLGDGVYAIGWDSVKKRPRLAVWDPGFYFPEFDAMVGTAEEFPSTVHIAYQFEAKDERTGENKLYTRRITWQMVEVENGPTLPWNTEPSEELCEFRDAVWVAGDEGETVYDFDDSAILYWNSRDPEVTDPGYEGGPVLLQADFLPVIHIPNNVALQNHFGDSLLANVVQVLDDIVANDTDISKAASTSGSPPIAVTGTGVGGNDVQVYGPGTILNVGDGSATVVDTSQGLKALMDLKNALLERLSVNSRTPESLVGRVKPNEVPSGIALTLSFTPYSNMIKEMRLVRSDKYRLMMKFVMRFFIVYGEVSQSEEFQTDLVFGSFLPADRQEAMTIVMNLLAAKAISLETGIRMLMEAGYPIEDWVEEINNIQKRDFAAASELAMLTGDTNAARAYIGMEPDPDLVKIDPNNPPDPADPSFGA